METVTIRLATDTDVPFILALISQPDMTPDSRLSVDAARELFHSINASGCHQLYVAERDGEVVGTFALIVVQQLSHNAARSAIVEDVVVRTDLQGLGIGQQMLGFAAARAQSLGCRKIVLSSGIARTNAHAFYERLGFQKDGLRFVLTMS